MESKYFLSEQDVRLLKDIISREEKNPGRLAHDNPKQENNNSPDIFVAVPPCGKGIPARSGTTPGMQMCCLFKLVAIAPTSGVSGFSYKLLPMLEPGSGSPISRPVYNIYDTEVPPMNPPNEAYIRVEKDKYGKWLNEPWNYPATSTTSTTTTTPCNGVCKGYCEWTWNGTCWDQGSNTCGNSFASPTTTTPQPCLCNLGVVSSTTTTTTTTSWCKYCFYPGFNGLTTGQCTYTYCSREQSPAILPGIEICNTTSTTSTTTTSVDCNTTSTTSQCSSNCGSNCTNSCVWAWQNGQWVLICQDCANCTYPTGATVNYCSALVIPCNNPTNTTAAPTPPCTGSCNWVWNSGSQCWTKAASACVGALASGSGGLIGNDCHGGSKCQCQPPSVDGNACEPNNVLTTYCQEAGTTTTSAPTPWMNCYTSSTTSSTTSTCANGCGDCLWSYSTGNWVNLQNNCNLGCFCSQPTIAGQATCQIQDTVCSTTTTSTTTTTTTSTTTSSTTSTTTTTSWYCCADNSGCAGGLEAATQTQCILGDGTETGPNYACTGNASTPYYCGGPFSSNVDCANFCTTSTTTTTTSTTTTTTSTTTTTTTSTTTTTTSTTTTTTSTTTTTTSTTTTTTSTTTSSTTSTTTTTTSTTTSSTTSTTTSTPCSGNCNWICNGTTWVLMNDSCTSNCPPCSGTGPCGTCDGSNVNAPCSTPCG